jgi:predicted Zn-dependent protease
MTRTRQTSTTGRLSRLLLFLFGLALAPLVTGQGRPSTLPEMGDPSAQVLTPQAERRIGQALMQSLRAKGMLHDDALVTGYVESLGNRLAANSGLGPGAITFFVVRDRAINAFAAPGGVIGIHTGLLLASRTESELAAVIAHELAHVSQRHMARTYEAAGQMQIASAVALLAALLLGQVDGELGEAALATTLGGSAQAQLNFIRSNEEEADRIGIQILARTGLDPFGMPDFFGRLQQNQRLYGDALPEFLRTHPVNVSRIASAVDRASQLPRPAPRDETAFAIARLRLEVLDSVNVDTRLDEFTARVRRGDDQARYALALAQLEHGKGPAALTTLEPLIAAEPDRVEYLVARAQALAVSGQRDAALREYRDALQVFPGHRALTEAYARLLIDGDQPREAQILLVDEVNNGRSNRTYFQLLNDASVRLQDEVSARRARAELLLLDGRDAEATEELRKALRVADGYDSARIAARLAEVERRLNEQARAEKP